MTAVRIDRRDAGSVQATVAGGWYLAWWPGSASPTNAKVTTASGTSTEAFSPVHGGPCPSGATCEWFSTGRGGRPNGRAGTPALSSPSSSAPTPLAELPNWPGAPKGPGWHDLPIRQGVNPALDTLRTVQGTDVDGTCRYEESKERPAPSSHVEVRTVAENESTCQDIVAEGPLRTRPRWPGAPTGPGWHDNPVPKGVNPALDTLHTVQGQRESRGKCINGTARSGPADWRGERIGVASNRSTCEFVEAEGPIQDRSVLEERGPNGERLNTPSGPGWSTSNTTTGVPTTATTTTGTGNATTGTGNATREGRQAHRSCLPLSSCGGAKRK